MSTVKSSRTTGREVPAPQIKVTKHDIFVGAFTTMAFFTALTLLALVGVWLSNVIPRPSKQHIEMLPMVKMDSHRRVHEDGTPNAAPLVDSPEEQSLDPSLATEATNDVTQLQAVAEQVMEFGEDAAQLVTPNEFTGARNTGIPGSADGTGSNPIGLGDGRGSGETPEQKWFVEFADEGDLKSYAAQLDFFGIELGAKFEAEGRLVYLSNLSRNPPTTRAILASEGGSEKRLILTWAEESSDRRQGDVELFQKVGIDASEAVIMHFYPAATELHLAKLELEFGGHVSAKIRGTWFRVRKAGNGYEFFVYRQILN